MTRVYAPDASPRFNEWMDDLNRRLTEDTKEVLGDNLVALLLGGGYGHGEGGLVVDGDTEKPYNDLDYSLVVQRKHAGILPSLDPISEKYAAETRIHVDYSRPLTMRDVQRMPHWMMWHDLVNGHIVLYGPEDILTANAPASILGPLPLIEATRLLLNRGAGLLWSKRVLQGVEEEPDEGFVKRNYFKCVLALGDALLVAYQRHQTDYTGRDANFTRLADEEPEVARFDLVEAYAEALRFKFRPDLHGELAETTETLDALAEKWSDVFLHIECMRTEKPWESIGEYVSWSGLREPEEHTPAKLVRNVLQNLKLGEPGWKYQRESLYPRLPVLLGTAGPAPVAGDWGGATRDFLETWERFN